MVPANNFHPHNHEVLFYSHDAAYVEAGVNFIAGALAAGDAAVAVATKRHRDLLHQALKLRDLKIDAALEQGAFILLDAAEALAELMVNGWPDRVRFFSAFDNLMGLVSAAPKSAAARIAVFGEAVALLCEQGDMEAAIRMEQLGNHLGKRYNVDVLCAYPVEFCDEQHENQIKRICAQHSAIYSR